VKSWVGESHAALMRRQIYIHNCEDDDESHKYIHIFIYHFTSLQITCVSETKDQPTIYSKIVKINDVPIKIN
jgi:hypothetical protein